MEPTQIFSTKLQAFFKKYIELDTSLESGENYADALDLFEEFLGELDFKIERIKIPEEIAGSNREHLIGRKDFSDDLPTLVIYSHIDVVPANYPDAFKFKIENGKAFGRGTADHKGGTVASLCALEELKDKDLRFNIIIWCTTDEETEQLEQLRFMNQYLKLPENSIIFDTDTFAGGVTIGRLGLMQMEINVKGKSCHSAMANLGRNAIEDTAKLITFFTEIRKEYESRVSKFKAFKSSKLDFVCSRCNVNKISGGIADNTIPDNCFIKVDCRFIPEDNVIEEKEKLIKRISEFCEKEKIQYEFGKIELYEGRGTEHPLASEFNEIYKKYSPEENGLYCILGSTPLAHWSKELNLPHFGLGVARGECNVHGVGEFCFLKDIYEVSQTIKDFLSLGV